MSRASQKNRRGPTPVVQAPHAATPTPRCWTAEQLAAEAGVGLERVSEAMRQCYMPEEVFLERSDGMLRATQAGRERVRAILDAALAAQPAQEPRSSPTSVETASARERLLVTRVWGAKRVICRRVNGVEVVCRVQDASNLMPGMELVDAQAGVDGLWSYYGRLPRRRGRW